MNKVFNGLHKNLTCRVIENDLLRVAVAPQLGAKIVSLFYKPQNFEVLFQPTADAYRLPEYGADFSAYDTSGADEMFPTIDACHYPFDKDIRLPDHGELWSMSWQLEDSGDCIETTARGVALPYLFKRRLSLTESGVRLEYELRNLSSAALYGLWAFHGLVACDEKSRIILPQAKRVVMVHDSALLGSAGTEHDFPVAKTTEGAAYRLDQIAPYEAAKTEKWYLKGLPGKEGAMLLLNSGKLCYRLSFDETKLPYLGVWLNEGGFKGEYNCALEPSDGFYDSAEIAFEQGCLPVLAAGESRRWDLGIELSVV